MLDILRIYMRIYYAHHRISGVCYEHVYMVYMWHVYRLFYNMLDMLDILRIYVRIYCVYSAHIWCMSPNIGIT